MNVYDYELSREGSATEMNGILNDHANPLMDTMLFILLCSVTCVLDLLQKVKFILNKT